MYELVDGCLKINNKSFRDLAKKIHSGVKPKEALANDLKNYDLDVRDVYSIELTGSQMAQRQIIDIYSAIVTDIWDDCVR